MYKPIKVTKPEEERTLEIVQFFGLNISVNNTQIEVNESPDMLNMLPDDRGALDKIPGVEAQNDSLGDSMITGLLEYKKTTGSIFLFGHDTDLYKITDFGTFTYSKIYESMSGDIIRGFTYNNTFYMLDGTTYLQYDGTTVKATEGYVPTVLIGTDPTGSGTAFEAKNYIQPGFKVLFSADGTDTDYYLPYESLDATEVTITVDGAAKVEDTDFTVNRTTGVVSFTYGTPPATAPNNVEITAYKTVSGDADKINGCTIFTIWSGSDGARVWISGNSTNQNRDYRSGVKDPTYFPNDGYDDIGSDDSAIIGYSKLYDRLIIYKESQQYTRTYIDNNGEAVFVTQLLNSAIGSNAKDSFQILDNFPAFLTKKGAYLTVSIDPQNEQNVVHISNKVDRNADPTALQGILDMGNIEDYVSIDFKNSWWLFNPNNGYVWVYDYRYIIDGVGQWFRLDNMYASCALEVDGELWYGDSRTGQIYKLKTIEDTSSYCDDDGTDETAKNAYWTSLVFDFNTISRAKLVSKVFFSIKPSSQTSATLYTRSNLRAGWKEIKTISQNLFSYSNLVYETFVYATNTFPQPTKAKTKDKKVTYYQLKIGNNVSCESLGLLNVLLKYRIQREIKE
jgi:hypothetical protein